MRYEVWQCRIVVPVGTKLPVNGADTAPRVAAIAAVEKMTGKPVVACLSGWGHRLTDLEEEIIEESRP